MGCYLANFKDSIAHIIEAERGNINLFKRSFIVVGGINNGVINPVVNQATDIFPRISESLCCCLSENLNFMPEN